MFKIYNSNAISRTERMKNAVIMGSIATVACLLITTGLKFFGLAFDIIYVGYGFLIGYAIQYFGKGVHLQFSILGVGLAVVAVLISDLIYAGFDLEVLKLIISTFDVFSIVYRGAALVMAFRYARLVG